MTTRILIADDEPNILISLEYLMKRQGYEVFVARDGQEALDLLRAHLPRLVLLDVICRARVASRSARNCAPTRPSRTRWC